MYTRRGWIIGVGSLGAAALLPGATGSDWPQFRGADRTNISSEKGLLRKWPAGGPKTLWSVPVAQGYAGAAIVGGRVYDHDYDVAKSEWLVNCRSLADGKLVWQFREAREIRPNHAITRTVPAVDSRFVISLDPKAVLHCLNARTGKEVWRKSLVTEYKAAIPPWYNGQNPLQEANRIILGVGGPDALMVAIDKATGKDIWRAPNASKHQLSHTSVMPAVLGGVRQYLWGTLKGPVSVSTDGQPLWEVARKFNVAVAPSPLAVDGERVFMTGSYDAGSAMFRVRQVGGKFQASIAWDMKKNEWNTEVHTPIVYKGRMFAIGKKKRGLFTCMDFDGKEVWTSEGKATFGLGGFLMADGMFFAMDGDSGKLRLIEASLTGYNELASAQALKGQEVWGPLALSGGKLVARDLSQMVCLQVGA